MKKRDHKGIHDRFLRDHVFRERMLENNRDEDVCREWDVLAEQDHTHPQPVRKRSDFDEALSVMADFGQSDFGQSDFGQPFLPPSLANPTLASVSVLVVWPTLAKTNFGQCLCVFVCVCVCLCVSVCVCVCLWR